MKKIVPFNKDINFDAYIYEICSISLEHTLSLKENNIISGNFVITGTYKMTDSSTNVDSFNYNLPFEISIDSKYDTKNLIVDINDFYYEVMDNKILSVNIDVLIDGLEEKEEKVLEEVRKTDILDEKTDEEDKKVVDIDNNEIENIDNKNTETNIKKEVRNDEEKIVTTIFDDLDCNENYVTYKVHIVGENDTIESIIQKYNINSSELEDYNNLSDLKLGDKLIIPTND